MRLWAAVGVVAAVVVVEGSRVWVDEAGGYREVVAVIHPALRPHNCTSFFNNLKVRRHLIQVLPVTCPPVLSFTSLLAICIKLYLSLPYLYNVPPVTSLPI